MKILMERWCHGKHKTAEGNVLESPGGLTEFHGFDDEDRVEGE